MRRARRTALLVALGLAGVLGVLGPPWRVAAIDTGPDTGTGTRTEVLAQNRERW